MDKTTMIKRTLSGVLVGGMLLSGSVAFADDATKTTVKDFAGKLVSGEFGGKGGGLGKGGFERGGFGKGDLAGDFLGGPGRGHGSELSEENLAQLVSDGVITQEKADAIKAYTDKLTEEKEAKAEEMKAKMEELKNLTPGERKAQFEQNAGDKKAGFEDRKDLFTELVSNNILTQDEADAIKASLKEKAAAESRQKTADNLSDLVEKGTLTQTQVDQILDKYESIQKDREAQMEKMKAMTDDERKAYFEANKDNAQKPADLESQLVEAGIITQEQADAIKANMTEKAEKENQQRLTDKLAAFVEKGTITQDQSDKILAALNTAQEAQKANLEKLKDMTQEEREQYFQTIKENAKDDSGEHKKGDRVNPLSQLVEDGTLTQEQADAIGGLFFHR